MDMDKKPYRIAIKMVSPIVVGKFPLHLDSLFYWLLSEFLTEQEVFKALDDIIEKSADNTYLCSAMYFDKKPMFKEHAITSNSDQMIDKLFDMSGWSDADKNAIGKMKLAKVNAIHAKKAFFNATCNKEKVHALLSRINGIGRLTNSGYGEIESITFQELSADESLLSNGKLMRVISDDGYSDEMLKQVGAIRGYGRSSLPYHTCSKSSILIPTRLAYISPKSIEHKKHKNRGLKK